MLCREIMKRRVCTARHDDSVRTVARIMREEDVGVVPVCGDDGAVLGVITDRDLALRVCATDAPMSTLASEAMTRAVVAVRPDDSVARAEQRMRRHHLTRVLVTTRDGHLEGILSLSDLALYEQPGRIARTLRSIAERKYVPGGPP